MIKRRYVITLAVIALLGAVSVSAVTGKFAKADTAPFIKTVTPAAVSVGDTTTLSGSGFDSNSNIFLNSLQVATVPQVSADGSQLSFTIPSSVTKACARDSVCSHAVEEIIPGVYYLNVTNGSGISNTATLSIQSVTPSASTTAQIDTLINTQPLTAASSSLYITSIDPQVGDVGTVITLTGGGFYNPQGAQSIVINGTRIRDSVASSTDSYSFILPALDNLSNNTSYPLYMRLVDSNGVVTTSNSVLLTYTSNQVASNLSGGTTLSTTTRFTSGVYLDNTGTSGFKDNTDGTVKDKTTKLVWQQCVSGTTGDNCQGDFTRYSLSDASAMCSSLTLGGYTGWRLPSLNEFEPFESFLSNNQSVDTTYFPNDPQDFLWTDTKYNLKTRGIPKDSTYVVYYDGTEDLGFSGNNFPVRCVRDPLTSILAPVPEPVSPANPTIEYTPTTISNGGGGSMPRYAN